MAKQQFEFDYLAEIAFRFLAARPQKIERYGKGAINDTFKVLSGNKSYLLQRVNSNYFTQPLVILENFKRITARGGHQLGLRAVAVSGTVDLWHQDGSGDYWRLFDFVDHSYSCSRLDKVYQAYEIAKAYGQYLQLLSGLSLTDLRRPVEDFHDTIKRYRQLLEAVKADSCNRLSDCRVEVEFVKSKLEEILEFANYLESIPARLAHNDTGIDNVLLDKNTGAALAVIDWDTTMPGYSVVDFGDLFRSALGVEFDERLSAAECFSALLSGYLAGTGRLLLPEEIKGFAAAGKVISLELGIRYLTDYLTGDKVFLYDNGASLLRARKCLLRYKIMDHNAQQFERIADNALAVYCA